MPRIALAAVLLLALWPQRSGAEDRAGDFDYYVLALSWNAAWCEAEGAGRAAPQCDPDRDIGFVLHGLWPQREDGWPEFCRTPRRDPSRAESAAMADIMGSPGLAWYQWKKHGRCSGLDPADYFALAREAWDSINLPEVLTRIRIPMRIAPRAIKDAFLAVNPGLRAGGVTVVCQDRRFDEVRICLSKSLVPRACSGGAARDCALADPIFVPMR